MLIVPSITLNFGSEYLLTAPWTKGYATMERVQLTWFSAQEMFMSGIYIAEAIRMLRLGPERNKRRIKILYELLVLNLVAIVMDISLIVLEYLGFYFFQIILKATVYSIKLKMEFAVLGLLVSIVSNPLPVTGLEVQRSRVS